MGCDFSGVAGSCSSCWFQFTPPVWGATLNIRGSGRQVTVSIHAPRVGCDYPKVYETLTAISFNSRTPCGVRHKAKTFKGLFDVSIHAPRVGCDQIWCRKRWGDRVSIHAPRVGCDNTPINQKNILLCFNSRTPCGVRQYNSSNK